MNKKWYLTDRETAIMLLFCDSNMLECFACKFTTSNVGKYVSDLLETGEYKLYYQENTIYIVNYRDLLGKIYVTTK